MRDGGHFCTHEGKNIPFNLTNQLTNLKPVVTHLDSTTPLKRIHHSTVNWKLLEYHQKVGASLHKQNFFLSSPWQCTPQLPWNALTRPKLTESKWKLMWSEWNEWDFGPTRCKFEQDGQMFATYCVFSWRNGRWCLDGATCVSEKEG